MRSQPLVPVAGPSRVLWLGAAALIAVHLAVRGYVLARGNFYWDDVAFFGRSTQPLSDLSGWFTDYDGHVMPGALVTAAVITKLAPLSWPAAALSLLVLQLVAALVTLRTLVIVAGRRPGILVPFAFYLFTPITLTATAWWASGLNALPLQIGLAVAVAETVRHLRGHRRSAVWAVLAVLVTLLFFEKALIIPFVAVAAVCLAAYLRRQSVRAVLRRGRWLWAAYAVVVVGWFALWMALTAARPGDRSVWFTVSALVRSVTSVLGPAALGGPWTWTRRNPGPPVVVPDVAITVVGLLAIAAIVGFTWWRAPRAVAAWAAAGGYFVAAAAPVFFLRSSQYTSWMLPLSLRYFADVAWVLCLAGALALIARPRPVDRRWPGRWPGRSLPGRRWWIAVLVAFVVSATGSSVRFAQVWSDNPTGDYLTNLREGARTHAGRSMLDQEINVNVLARLAYPNNQLSRVLSPLPERPWLTSAATENTVVDAAGRFVAGRVTRVRTMPLGGVPGCGTRVDDTPVLLRYEGPLAYWEWVVELNYLASADGEITAQQELAGGPVRVPVAKGAHTVYVRAPGTGGGLTLRALTPGLVVCAGSGPVGLLVPASLPGR